MPSERNDRVLSNCWLLWHYGSLNYTHEVWPANSWSTLLLVVYPNWRYTFCLRFSQPKTVYRGSWSMTGVGGSESSRSRDIYNYFVASFPSLFLRYVLSLVFWTGRSHSPQGLGPPEQQNSFVWISTGARTHVPVFLSFCYPVWLQVWKWADTRSKQSYHMSRISRIPHGNGLDGFIRKSWRKMKTDETKRVERNGRKRGEEIPRRNYIWGPKKTEGTKCDNRGSKPETFCIWRVVADKRIVTCYSLE